jgi:hypothetical protein
MSDHVIPKAADAWINDDSKNPWRLKPGDGTVIEILMKNGFITEIDAGRHAEVKIHRWHALKGRNTSYAKTAYFENGEWKHVHLHVLLFPNIKFPRDHINHNGLDNRAVNVRDGSLGLNARNVNLISGGVIPDEKHHRWCAQWTNIHGQQKVIYFPWLKDDNASKEAEHAVALKYRAEIHQTVLQEISVMQAKPGGSKIEKKPRAVKRTNTGVHNLSFVRRGTGSAGVLGHIIINGESHRKWIALSQYADEEEVISGRLHAEDFGIDAGMQWLEEIERNHKRLPPKRKKRVYDATDQRSQKQSRMDE